MKPIYLRFIAFVICVIGVIGLATGNLITFGSRGIAHTNDLFTPYISFGVVLVGISACLSSYWQTTGNKKLLFAFRAVLILSMLFLWVPVAIKLIGAPNL
jgi:hypothetical protein